MTRFAWLTDIHLNFLTPERTEKFLEEVRQLGAHGVLIGGDIAEAHDLVPHLERLDDHLQVPIYFVLGNHDYYFGSIAQVRAEVRELCDARPRLHYLSDSPPLGLTAEIGLVGHDGWADARHGDYLGSLVSMNDFKLIGELAGHTKEGRRSILEALGDEAAAHVARQLPAALERYPHVVLLTHVPPVREACWHQGRLSDDQWAPHFSCKAMGDVILEIMPRWPDRQLTVLCGHTHGRGETMPLPNIKILTGGADYGQPKVQAVFEW